MELYKQNRFEQAWPLVEILAVAHPQDSALQEMLGSCRLAHSVDLTDPEERRQMRVRARQAFLRAKELGDNSNYLQIGLPAFQKTAAQRLFRAAKMWTMRCARRDCVHAWRFSRCDCRLRCGAGTRSYQLPGYAFYRRRLLQAEGLRACQPMVRQGCEPGTQR